jgi:hypothetical protein
VVWSTAARPEIGEDKDKKVHYTTEVVCQKVEFLGSKDGKSMVATSTEDAAADFRSSDPVQSTD